MSNEQPPPMPPVALGYAVPSGADSPWGKGFVAVCANFVLWGLGHFIAGQRRRGVIWFGVSVVLSVLEIATISVPRLIPFLLVLAPIHVVLFVVLLLQSFRMGRQSSGRMLGHPAVRYLAGFGLLMGAYVESRLVRRPLLALTSALGDGTYAISSNSMRPTLRPGDRIITHRSNTISRWDLVVFHPPQRGDIFTQRVVGLPGETVEIVNGVIRINNIPIASPPGIPPYVGTTPRGGPGTGCEWNPIHLAAGEYYLLGDNSPISYDARYWRESAPGHQLGAVPRESIVGKVLVIYWPLSRLWQFK
jgi:signal peptidase I